MIMKKAFLLLLFVQSVALAALQEPARIPLAGEWRFSLDRSDAGIAEGWFNRDLSDRIQLPGVLQAQGYGDEISVETPWVLSLYDRFWYLRDDYLAYTNAGNVKVPFVCQPPRHYLGAAWYQRDIEIPATWKDRRVVLLLERPRWESRVWIDDTPAGTNNSLCAPHEYDLGVLAPGKHRLTVRVDNRMLMNYRPDAHAVSDSLGSSWNGIVGQMELHATPLVWIDEVKVFPDVTNKSILVRGVLGNRTASEARQQVRFAVEVARGVGPVVTHSIDAASAPGGGAFEATISLGDRVELWSEFNPFLYRLTVRLDNGHSVGTLFGMRDFRAEGTEFVINGEKANLRGTHHGGDFPLTGYPPTDVDYWHTLFWKLKEWGINHVRFHSFCPPEAAFIAGDMLGMYLQPEPGMWNEISPNTPMERMLYLETERMLKAYGNHPSFVLFSPSNEPKGRWKEALPKWAAHFRSVDPRRLYTSGTGFTDSDAPGPLDKVDYIPTQRFGPRRVRGEPGWFGADYSSSLGGVSIPVLAHENGQWCAYPDYDVISKFTGYLRPGNFEIFRGSLAARGMLHKNKDFAWASGRFQLACYKEEIEANLRTPGLVGFQLLDLHDYIGQGTALVGLLDPFWEEKGYVTAAEFRRFCSPTVPLARLRQRVYTTGDSFNADVEIAHYGPAALSNAVAAWRVVDDAGAVVARGEWEPRDIPIGKSFRLGTVKLDLTQLTAPRAYRLVVTVRSANPGSAWAPNEVENDWQFWLYPQRMPESVPADVLVTSSWPEAEARLASGGKVLFTPRNADLHWTSPPLAEVPVFWNRLMNPGWSRMLGLWCDTNHPALAQFPTEANCDWQWTQIVRGVRPVNLEGLPRELQPIVQAIDDWNRNWKLGAVFECTVGSGRLLVCSFDIERNLDSRPVARQLRHSLLAYMQTDAFQPKVSVTPAQFATVLFDSQVMRKLGARASGDGTGASLAIDGDPNTVWTSGGGRGASAARHPHQLTVAFERPVNVEALIVMNRQNDRNHAGDIRDYRLQASEDGQEWRAIAEGRLASTWSPQRIELGAPVTAKHLRLTALSGFGTDSTAAIAELAVLEAGTRVTGSGGTIEYQRSRSTSTDVEEGGAAPLR